MSVDLAQKKRSARRRRRKAPVPFAVLIFGLLLLALSASIGTACAVFRWRSQGLAREDRRRTVQNANALAALAVDQHLRQWERVLERLAVQLPAAGDGAEEWLRREVQPERGASALDVLAVRWADEAWTRVAGHGIVLPEAFDESLPGASDLSVGWAIRGQGGAAILVHSLPMTDPSTGEERGILHGGVRLDGNAALLDRLQQSTGAAGYALMLDGRLLASTVETPPGARAGIPPPDWVSGVQSFPRTPDDRLRLVSYDTVPAVDSLKRELREDLLGLLPLVLAAAIGASALFARWVTRPVRRLMGFARAIAAGGIPAPLRPCRVLELDSLASILGETVDQLRAREADLDITLQSIGDGVIATDVRGGVARMNRVAEALTGWPQAEAIGRPLAEVFRPIRPGTREPLANPADSILQGGAPAEPSGSVGLLARDGAERRIQARAAPIRAPDGHLRGVVLSFRDLTREHQATSARLEAEQRLATLSQNLADALVYQLAVNPSTGQRRFTYISESVERIHGIQAADIMADPQRLYGQVIEEDRPLMARALDQSRATLNRFTAEVRIRLPSGETRWIMLTSTPRLAGEEILWDGIELDITERKLAEEERQMLESQLVQAQKMDSIGQLAGGVAHDFNNMLGVILGNTEMALESLSPDQPLHAELLEVRKAAERSANLTRQLLAFARKQPADPRVLDLNETVEGMLKMIRRLIGESVAVDWRPVAEGVRVEMDPSQIDQILVNLCVNARDAIGAEGRVAISTGAAVFDEAACTRRPGAFPGRYAWIAVEDNGHGMDTGTLEHIFEPFFTTKGAGRGTGLGLATVYGIVRQNRGFIGVDSTPGRGTAFTIYLPRSEAEGEPVPESVPARSTLGPGSRTVLLVEDEPAILQMVRHLLERWGCTVLAAESPAEAIRLAREHSGNIDLLLTDVVMPDMNGRELARRLQQMRPGLRCLFMSGHMAGILAQHGVLGSHVHFIHKPFTARSLMDKVREAMDAPARSEEEGGPA